MEISAQSLVLDTSSYTIRHVKSSNFLVNSYKGSSKAPSEYRLLSFLHNASEDTSIEFLETGSVKHRLTGLTGSMLTGHQVDRLPGLQFDRDERMQVDRLEYNTQLSKILQNCEMWKLITKRVWDHKIPLSP